MKRSELLDQIEAYLALNTHVSDETAEGMKFLRKAFIELRRPTDDNTEVTALRADLASADSTVAAMNDQIATYEDTLYDLLLQAGLLPQIDGEPAITLSIALKEDPECLEKLSGSVGFGGYEQDNEPTDSDRFISGVYNLLGVEHTTGLEGLFSHLEGKAQYLSSLESGLGQRDTQIQHLTNSLGQCLEAAGQDWQDVDDLPDVIRDLRVGIVGDNVPPLPVVWVQDAIDLAHAVRGDLSPENRVMAKAAEAIILSAPKGEA